MTLHKLVYLLIVLVMLATPLAACQPTPAPPSSAGTTGGLAQNQVLRLVVGVEPPSLDPTKAEDTASSAILYQLHEGLMRFRPDLSVEPGLAESYTISPDGKTYAFKIRGGLKFSDGTPASAADFEYSIKRLLDPRTASPYASVMTDEIVGAAAFNSTAVPTDTAKLPQLEAGVGVKATDASTLQITLNNPATYFLSISALWSMVPLKKDAIDKGGDKWTEPGTNVGTGPFMLKEWKHGASLTLVANPSYWDKKPTLQQIQVSIIDDPKAAEEAYKNNELDISTGIPQSDIEAIRSDPTLSKQIVPGGGLLATYYIGFNTLREPFTGEKGKLVRQAFSQAIDRQTLINVVQKGVGAPAQSFVPPGMPGHQPNIGFKYDPAAAKATLQKAGYSDGAALGKIQLFYNTGAAHKAIMEFVADQLKKNLGVDTDIQAMEWGTYLAALKTKDAPHMWRNGWNADYPHPNNFLNLVFNSKSTQNFSKYNNPQFDKFVADAAKEPDAAKQLTLYNQAQQVLVDDAPVIFLYWYGRFRLAKPWVMDLVPTPADGDFSGQFFFRSTKIAQH